MTDFTPPELAHQRVIETDSMTLSIGSIFGDQNQPSRNAPYRMIPKRTEAPDDSTLPRKGEGYTSVF